MGEAILTGKSGGTAVNEPFDFPLSIQTAEPTPVNTNHIWIQRDAVLPFTIDEAIRATDWSGDNRFYGIVDNTDNNSILAQAPKKMTNDSVIDVVIRHFPKDEVPLIITTGNAPPYAKKYGLGYYMRASSKWPRILSRINGVIDIENAKRWDGSAWKWLSQKGHYLFNNQYVMNRTESIFSNERVYNSSGNNYGGFPAVTLDGLYVAVANATEVRIFLRTGDTFTLNTSYAINSNNDYVSHRSIAFSPDGQYLAIPGITLNADTWVTTILKKQSNGTWAKLTDVRTGFMTAGAGWSTDGSKLVTLEKESSSSTNWKPYVYNRSGDTFSLLKIAAGYQFGTGVYPRVFMVGNIVVVGWVQSSNSASYVTLFNISNDSYNNFSHGTYATTVKSMEYVSGNIFITHNNSGQLIMLDVSLGSGAEKYRFQVGSTITSFAITQDKKLLFVNTVDGLKIYSVDVSSGFTYIGTTTIMNNGNNDRLACW